MTAREVLDGIKARVERIADFETNTAERDRARLSAALDAALTVADDLKTRGDAIEEKGNNGSIYSHRAEGRGIGYREAQRLIRNAIEGALQEEQ